jgi:hypothetical protein
MNPFRVAISAMAVFMVPGCFLKMETVGLLLKYQAPFGTQFVKPGMTREERLLDLAACGTSCGLGGPCFSKEAEEKKRKELAKQRVSFALALA